MTATCADSPLVAKGLDISLAALKRQDPYINTIVDVASQVALYTFNRANEWEKTPVEGTLFIYTRMASPRHGFTIMNRLSMENLTEPITKDLDFQLQDPFLLYRNARLAIHGIWFYDKEDCQRIARRMTFLTQQEQVQAQVQAQGEWPSPGASEGRPTDIIQMLSKARNDYDKGKSEPQEMGSVLYGNPNVIKPIPVKPNHQENSLPRGLFGIQHLSQPPPTPPFSSSSSMNKSSRAHVIRSLTFDSTTQAARRDEPEGRHGPQNVKPKNASQQQQPVQSQQCQAILKLMQGQRGVLQTVSECPENNWCHYEQQQFFQQLQPHGHQQIQQIHPQMQPQNQQPAQSDPKSLVRGPTSVPAQSYFSLPLRPSVPVQSAKVRPQYQNQSPAESQRYSHSAARFTASGYRARVPGVVSPRELIQKLQLVQQEQSRSDPPHAGPALATSFAGLSLTSSRVPDHAQVSTQTPATMEQKAALQFQVTSPQRIPATVGPTMLMSPSDFTQTEPSPASAAAPRPSPNLIQIQSRSQLQATLVHLIQNDPSFLDSIYEVYSTVFSTDAYN